MSRISIRTRLSPDQAADVVRELIRPEGFLGGLAYVPSDRRPFIGWSKGDRFKFRRRLPWGWHNSFQPIIVGHVRPIPHGSLFDVSIRPHLFVAVFTPVLFLMLATEALRGAGDYALFLFLTLFGGFAIVSYRYESRKAERILRDAFEHKGSLLPDVPRTTRI